MALLVCGLGSSDTRAASIDAAPHNEGIESEIKPAPVVSELSILRTPDQSGTNLDVTVEFYFYEIPPDHLDSVWSVVIQIAGPGIQRRFQSDLEPIRLGTRERYAVSQVLSAQGNYSISAGVYAFTARSEPQRMNNRGKLFSRWAEVADTVITVGEVGTQTGKWVVMNGTELFVRPHSSSDTPASGRMIVSDGSSYPKVTTHRDNTTETSKVFRFHVRPYRVEPLDNVVVGHVEFTGDFIYVFQIDGADSIDSVKVHPAELGVVDILNESAVSFRSVLSPSEGFLLLYSGERSFTVFIGGNRQTFSVTGMWQFKTDQGTLLPAAGMYTAIYYKDGLGDWQILDDGFTDNTGLISLLCDQMDFSIFLFAENTDAAVFYCRDHHFDDGEDLIWHTHGWDITNPSYGNVNLDTSLTNVSAAGTAGAFNIAQYGMAASNWIISSIPTHLHLHSRCYTTVLARN